MDRFNIYSVSLSYLCRERQGDLACARHRHSKERCLIEIIVDKFRIGNLKRINTHMRSPVNSRSLLRNAQTAVNSQGNIAQLAANKFNLRVWRTRGMKRVSQTNSVAVPSVHSCCCSSEAMGEHPFFLVHPVRHAHTVSHSVQRTKEWDHESVSERQSSFPAHATTR